MEKYVLMLTSKGLVFEPARKVYRHGLVGKVIFKGNLKTIQKIILENEKKRNTKTY